MDFVRRLVGSKPKKPAQPRARVQQQTSDRSMDEPTVFRPVPQFEPKPAPARSVDAALNESSSRGRPDQLTMLGEIPAGGGAEPSQPGGDAATVYIQVPPDPTPEPPPRRQIATLNAVEGELEGQVFAVLEGENQIGRSPDSEVVLSSRFVSRVHAKLVCNSGRISFVPVSDQLTLINGEAAKKTDLKDGDKIQLGRTTLQLRIEG